MLFFEILTLPQTLCAAPRSPLFSHGLRAGRGTYLHVLNQHDVDRICNTAYHLTQRSHSETARLYILGVYDEFCSFLGVFFADFAGISGSCFNMLDLF